MFPYVMLATTLLFYGYDWPRRALQRIACSKPRDSLTSQSLAPPADDVADADNDEAINDDDDDIPQNTLSTTNVDNEVPTVKH